MSKRSKSPKRIDGLIEVPDANGGIVLYKSDREEVHYLNSTAALVLELCTGENSTSEIARLLRDTYGLKNIPQKDVDRIVRQMSELRLVRDVP
jgi:hypothetical protein